MDKPVRILHLEDYAADAELVRATLEEAGVTFQMLRVQTAYEFRQALAGGGYNVILADYTLPAYDGMSAMQLARELCPAVPFIFVSGTMGENAAIEALISGAPIMCSSNGSRDLGRRSNAPLRGEEPAREQASGGEAAATRGAATVRPETGKPGRDGARHRPRLQQHPGRDRDVGRVAASGGRLLAHSLRAARRDREGDAAGRRGDASDPHVRRRSRHRSDAARSLAGRRGHEEDTGGRRLQGCLAPVPPGLRPAQSDGRRRPNPAGDHEPRGQCLRRPWNRRGARSRSRRARSRSTTITRSSASPAKASPQALTFAWRLRTPAAAWTGQRWRRSSILSSRRSPPDEGWAWPRSTALSAFTAGPFW